MYMVTMKNMDKGSEGHAVAVTSDPLYSGHCKALTLVISPCPQKSPSCPIPFYGYYVYI